MNTINVYNILLKETNAEIAIKCVLVMNNILGAFIFDYAENAMDMKQIRCIVKYIKALNLFDCVYMNRGLLVMKRGTKINFDVRNYKKEMLNKFLVYYPDVKIREEDKYKKYLITIVAIIQTGECAEEINICEIICENKNDNKLFDRIRNCLKCLNSVIVNKSVVKIYDFSQEDMITECAIFSKGIRDDIADDMKLGIKKMIEISDYGFIAYLHDNNIIDMFAIEKVSFVILIITMIQAADLYDIEDVSINRIMKERQTYFIKKYMETACEKKLDKEAQKYLEL